MTRSRRNNVLWTAVLAALVLAAFAATMMRKPVPAEEASATAPANTGRVTFLMEQQWLIRLKLAKVEEALLAAQIRSTGRVAPVPSKRAIVAPPVGGIVQSGSLPRIGQEVAQGDLLAAVLQTPNAAESAQIHIENTRVEAERRRLAQAEIEAAARLEEAEHDLGRSRRLFDKKAYSAKALEADELSRAALAAQLEAVRGQRSALQSTPLENTRYEARAPISGTVVAVRKAAGEQVAPGEAIVEIIALDTVWVEAPVFEKDLAGLRRDGRAVFTTAAYPGKEYEGRLVDIAKVIDEQTRTAAVVFEVPNRSGELSIGMQANLRLSTGGAMPSMLIPKEAVLDNEGRTIVYVLVSGEEFERREVVLGGEYGAHVAVVSGLRPGERVVTQGAYQLKLQELRPADAGAHTHEV